MHTTNDTAIAMTPNIAAFPALNPEETVKISDVKKPDSIPAHAPFRFIRFHNSPSKYGDSKEPAIVPHEKDISIKMGDLHSAIIYDNAINNKHSARVLKNARFLS